MTHEYTGLSPFELSVSFRAPFNRKLFSMVKRPVEAVLGLRKLDGLYRQAFADGEPRDFVETALKTLDITYEVPPEQLERIPRDGPVVIVANHPYGGIEGLVLSAVMRSIRPDSRQLSNHLLARVPLWRERAIFVDPFGRPQSARFNTAPTREALAWLSSGGALEVFPAGQVSHLDLKNRTISDRRWRESVARLIRRARAPVVPIFFEGRNDWKFQVAGLIHWSLRTIMLPRALLKLRGKTLKFQVGNLIPFSKCESFASDADMLKYLRMCAYMLRGDEPRKAARRRSSVRQWQQGHQAVVSPVEAAQLATEVATLPREQLLDSSGEFEVWWVEACQVPGVLREIGRLREITYRQVGEGTGHPIDLDRYDDYYLHLFVWNKVKREIIGAYRLGRTDQILPERGKNGLYSSKFFKFTDGFLAKLDPALELGRSFVRAEYQRQHSPMALLWKGIGAYVARHPKYKILFGMISISNDYLSMSRQMMIAFLRTHAYLADLAKLARPRKPPRWRHTDVVENCGRLVTDVNEVSSLISGIEGDQKGVPVLLRQYLRLNAKFISCNVVPFFGDVWAGLMLADLTETDPRVLERHLGKEGAARFLEHHRRPSAPKRHVQAPAATCS